jgi:osmotically-inducible protein OsmY
MTLTFHLTVIFLCIGCILSGGKASEGMPPIPEDNRSDGISHQPVEQSESLSDQLDDARIAVAIKHQLARIGGKIFSSIDVLVKKGIATLTGTADNLWTRELAKDVSQTIRGVRGVIDRLSVGPVGPLDDAALENYLHVLFFKDPVVELKDLRLTVKGGRVTLEGEVQSWQEKEMAINTVKMVRGIREVRDALKVQFITGRPDAEIQQEISRRLAFDAFVEHPQSVKVQVQQGKVVLSGAVQSVYEKTRIAELGWVKGVREVEATGVEVVEIHQNSMIRGQRPMPADSEIAEAIRHVLGYDPRVSSFTIQVSVEKGRVTLQGTVPFLSIKQEAEQDVLNTLGVRSVNNQLAVKGDSSLPDKHIRSRILTVFSYDPVLEKFSLAASVRDGTVLLTGTVDSLYERNHAEKVIAMIRGVQSVQNHIEFSTREEQKTDWEIQLDIENQVWWSPFLSEQDIVAMVENGEVTLTGSVEHAHQRLIAEQQAFEAGASVVRNQLRVGRSQNHRANGSRG